jgi:hypothetical protein
MERKVNATAHCHGLRSEKDEVQLRFSHEGSRTRSLEVRRRNLTSREPTDSAWIRRLLLSAIQGNRRDDTTPQQASLSGVIICPAYWKGQRLKVNSFT